MMTLRIHVIILFIICFCSQNSFSQANFVVGFQEGDLFNPGPLEVADLDNDGDLDFVVAAKSGPWDDLFYLNWFENDGNTPPDFQIHGIPGMGFYVTSLSVGDLNGDNHSDIIVGNSSGVFLYFHDGGASPSFTKEDLLVLVPSASRAKSVALEDVDSDGDLDALTAVREVILSPRGVVLGYEGRFSWWENIDGAGIEFVEHIIESDVDSPQKIYASDFDDDGDIDVFGMTSGLADDIIWYKNIGIGDSISFEKIYVEHSFQGAKSLSVADLDGDGNNDIAGAGDCWAEVYWWKYDDGEFISHSIEDEFSGANWIQTLDLDMDGDVDVLGTADAGIHWWENDGINPPSFEEHVLSSSQSSAVTASNLDNDPALEILGSIPTIRGEGRVVMWDQEIINSSFENEGEKNFELYPNPIMKNGLEQVSIVGENINGKVLIFDDLGSYISEKEIFNSQFSVGAIPSGVYLLKVVVEDNFFIRKMIVI